MKDLLQHIDSHFANNLPFVVYRKPNEKTIHTIFCDSDELNYITDYNSDSGFVFAPFNSLEKTILFPFKNHKLIDDFKFDEIINQSELKATNFSDDEKNHHHKLVEKAIAEIKANKLTKVVVSRKEKITSESNISSHYNNLLATYQNAFVYVLFHPKLGCWLGATPEKLLKNKDNKLVTMSLAGTQLFSENIVWKEKEIKEQKIVTDFIYNNLNEINETITLSKTKTLKAGKLAHLCTEITSSNVNKDLSKVIQKLHPTPAVCGMPKKESFEFIQKNENYDRSFYTGFLGELNFNNSSDLFVNLRCMQKVKNELILYSGGGIVKNSNPEDEWNETVHKMNTMKSIIS